MKEIKELKFEDLTLEQKLGLVLIGGHGGRFQNVPGELEFHLELIRKHALGGVWVSSLGVMAPHYKDVIRILKEAADYPLLIYTDAENGYDKYRIGKSITIGYTNNEEYAYTFGRTVGAAARRDGYNVVCNPLMDFTTKNVPCGGVVRTLSPDKEKVAQYAAAMARGMHDAGILTIGKHYPGEAGSHIDSHMAESVGMQTKEELIETGLYPYRKLMEQDLLDGVMVGHHRCVKIDPVYPCTLSRKDLDILRELGFDGLMVTDAMNMMGVVAKYGWEKPRGMAVEAGNDMVLLFASLPESYASMKKCYEEGILTDEQLDKAVRRVLAAQHKVFSAPEPLELTQADEEKFAEINRKCVAAVTDEGLTPTVSRDGRHLFVLLSPKTVDLEVMMTKIPENTFTTNWYNPEALAYEIHQRFPNSGCTTIEEFPTPDAIKDLCLKELEYDDVVFITFFEEQPYVGREEFTPRIVSLMEALQVTDRITALIHLGNPFLLEQLPHIPRIINGCKSHESAVASLDVLAGNIPAEGKIPYEIHLQEKEEQI